MDYVQRGWETRRRAERAGRVAANSMDAQVAAAERAVDEYLRDALQTFAPQAASALYRRIGHQFSTDWLVDQGIIRFSTPEREAAFRAIMDEANRLQMVADALATKQSNLRDATIERIRIVEADED